MTAPLLDVHGLTVAYGRPYIATFDGVLFSFCVAR